MGGGGEGLSHHSSEGSVTFVSGLALDMISII